MPMPLISDMAVFQRKLATLPLETYQAGETVLSAASTIGRLLILKKGAVAVVMEGVAAKFPAEAGRRCCVIGSALALQGYEQLLQREKRIDFDKS